MFERTISSLHAVEAAMKSEWEAAQHIAPVRGLLEDSFPQVVAIREVERHAARPEIAAIDRVAEAT